MKTQMRATLAFSAGHMLENEWCGRYQHGHRYTCTVEWDREGFPATDLQLWTVYRQRFLDLVLEMKDRDLNKMLGAQVPNVFGVAAFIMERLAMITPIHTVEVHEDDGPIAIIEKPPEF